MQATTLVLVGEQETLYDAAAAVARAREFLPRVQAVTVPGAAHDLRVTRPEAVHRLMLEFLARWFSSPE